MWWSTASSEFGARGLRIAMARSLPAITTAIRMGGLRDHRRACRRSLKAAYDSLNHSTVCRRSGRAAADCAPPVDDLSSGGADSAQRAARAALNELSKQVLDDFPAVGERRGPH